MELKKDRSVTKDPDGTLHSADDLGLGIGFRLFSRQSLFAKDEQINSPGRSARWNKHRDWYEKATPQLIYHVVFGCSDLDKPVGFYRDRLNFRITDVARDRGVFSRPGKKRSPQYFLGTHRQAAISAYLIRRRKSRRASCRRRRYAAQGLEKQTQPWPAPHFVDVIFLHSITRRRRSGVFR